MLETAYEILADMKGKAESMGIGGEGNYVFCLMGAKSADTVRKAS